MADLLTHVLMAYVLATVVRWRAGSSRRWVPVAMGGAAIPDLAKVGRLLDASAVRDLLGVPFSYAPIASVGGVVAVAAAITVAFDRAHWRHAYGSLLLGGFASLLLDGLRVYVDGAAGFWLYPVWVRPPTPSLYVSADSRVLAAGLAVAAIVAVGDRLR